MNDKQQGPMPLKRPVEWTRKAGHAPAILHNRVHRCAPLTADVRALPMKQFLLLMSLLSFLRIASAQDFTEGQVWSYKTRKGEESSRVLINKVETNPKFGKIFHISVSGVKVKNPRISGGISTNLPHFPVSEETLKKSLTKLKGKNQPNPDYYEGYQTWKSAFDKGNAGIFTIDVADIVGVVEEAINKP